MKPLLSGPPIKRTPSIKRTLSRVPKRTSDISLYNKPLLRRTRTQNNTVSCIWLISIVKKPLLSGHRTELTVVVMDYIFEIHVRAEVS